MSPSLPITARRLRQVMAESGCGQTDLAQAVGITQGAVSQILTGASRNSRHLPKIAANLRVNLDWLLGLTDDRIDMIDANGEGISEDDLALIRNGQHHKSLLRPEQLKPASATVSASVRPFRNDGDEWGSAPKPDVVAVRELDLSFGMGSTFLDVPVTEQVRHFPRAWLRQYTRASPDKLLFAQGAGDSMAPTLLDSDVMLIDCSQDQLAMADRIWAVAYAGCGMIKRLRPTPDGGVAILSDNPSVPDTIAYDGELHIIGRVVAVVRKI